MAGMSDPKPKRSPWPRRIALIILIVGVAVGAAVPLLDCPPCKGTGSLAEFLKNSKREIPFEKTYNCPDCDGGRKVTALKWILR